LLLVKCRPASMCSCCLIIASKRWASRALRVNRGAIGWVLS
jgi:hypothetical protein